MDERPDRQPIGTLWRVTADGRAEAKIEGLRVSNGLAWSPDGKTMFHSDSRSEWLDIWDFDAAAGGDLQPPSHRDARHPDRPARRRGLRRGRPLLVGGRLRLAPQRLVARRRD